MTREQVKAVAGGDTYQGIVPATKSGNLLMYSDIAVGREHGYNFDGQTPEGVYRYTGFGKSGDQQMAGRNNSVLEHVERGMIMRLFEATGDKLARGGRLHRYLGEFVIDGEDPYRYEAAPSTGGGPDRQVIVFNLLPVGDTVSSRATPPAGPTTNATVEICAPEDNRAKSAERKAVEAGVMKRREAELMAQLERWLEGNDYNVGRALIRLASGRHMWTDTYVEQFGRLYEVKADATRGNIRTAIGQLVDYAQFVEARERIIVLPERPADDLISLAAAGVAGVAWPDGDGFELVMPEDL